MQTERVWLETDALGHLVKVPDLPPCSRIEAIFLVPDMPGHKTRRVPSPELAAITQICGDLVEPAISPEDWDALK